MFQTSLSRRLEKSPRYSKDLSSVTAPYTKTKKLHKVHPGEHPLEPLPPDRNVGLHLALPYPLLGQWSVRTRRCPSRWQGEEAWHNGRWARRVRIDLNTAGLLPLQEVASVSTQGPASRLGHQAADSPSFPPLATLSASAGLRLPGHSLVVTVRPRCP